MPRQKTAPKYRHDELERYERLEEAASEAERRGMQEAADKADMEHVLAYNDYLQSKHLAEINAVRHQAAELRLSRMTITAPAPAEVTRILVTPGQRVEVGEPLLELRNMETMLTDFLLPESKIDTAALMDRAVDIEFEVAGQVQQLVGTVVSSDSEVNARGQVRVHVRITNQKQNGRWVLSHGKTVQLRLRDDVPGLPSGL
ncbi:MAG: HlyD family efflux transporter periplasmic adaptor subunit [Pirellulaceae bacterium]